MLRYLQVLKDKPIQILETSAALTRGACVAKDYATGKVAGATATGGFFLVDNAMNFDGINAVIAPSEGDFESIASGALCLMVPTFVGERYATSELTVGSLEVGDALKASAGKFVAGAQNDVCEWVYGGTYADPTGITMYIVERVAPITVA